MQLEQHLSKHLKDVFFGGNWTASSLKGHIIDVNWQKATTKVGDFNTIASLVYHMNYYVEALISVLEGAPLTAKDEWSFDRPAIEGEVDWYDLLDKVWSDVNKACNLIENMPDNLIWKDFTDPKYGNYYHNIQGTIEHTHYHLGQIILLKKLLE